MRARADDEKKNNNNNNFSSSRLRLYDGLLTLGHRVAHSTRNVS